MVRFNGVDYFYVYNLQGDVAALIDADSTRMVEYVYDAWGYLISKTGSLAAMIGTLNPFRYRGYVYDEETGLYYLRSRYYNPVWKRFVNADHIGERETSSCIAETPPFFEWIITEIRAIHVIIRCFRVNLGIKWKE